jgi:hypothetical protein
MVVLSWIGGAGVPEEGVDTTFAPVFAEELVMEEGVDTTFAPVFAEEFGFGDPCAAACSKKYVGTRSPNARMNAIVVQDIFLIFCYLPALTSLDLSATISAVKLT